MARLSILKTGIWNVPRNEIFADEVSESKRHKLPGFSVLVQDSQIGNVLYDTGITADWETKWGEEFKQKYTFDSLNRLDEELGKIGVKTTDVDLLVLSHLHYDHVGNLNLFKDTRAGANVLISEAEAQEVFPKVCMAVDGVSGAYFRDEIVMSGIGYQTIKEDTWISDDVLLFVQQGHTRGTIGMLVKTKNNGVFLFPSDAVYSELHFGPPIVYPGVCMDPIAYKENIEQLRIMQREYSAKIVFGHDIENLARWNTAPQWYE